MENARCFDNSLSADNNHTTERLLMSPNVPIVSSEQYSSGPSGLVLMNKLYEVLKDQVSTERKILDIETEFYFREIHEYRNVDQSSTMDLIMLHGKLEKLKIKTVQIQNELMRKDGTNVYKGLEGTEEKSRLDCIVDFIDSIEQCLQFMSTEKQNLCEKIGQMRERKFKDRNQENNDNRQDLLIPVNSESLAVGRKRALPRVSHIDILKKKKRSVDVPNLNEHFSTLRLNSEEIPIEENTDASGTSSKMMIEANRRLVVLLPRLNINEYLGTKLFIPGVVGLQNNGKWSYINSIVQCLSNTPGIAQFFIENPTLRDSQASVEIPDKSHQITVEFAALIRAIWSGSHRSVSPEALRDALAYRSQFDNKGRTDPYLILSYLLAMLHHNLKKEDNSRIIGPLLPDELQWHTEMKGQSSIISDLFYGQSRTSFTCPECGCKKFKYKIFHSINIPLFYDKHVHKPATTLNYLLTQSRRHRFNRGWSCPSCRHQGGLKKEHYTKLPPIVIIHLDRYAIFHRRRSINSIVKRVNPKDNFIKIPRLVQDKISGSLIEQTYELYAICGIKEQLKNGNFFAVCKNPANLSYRYRFEDENITEESPTTYHGRDSYLLFFKLYQHD